MSLYKEEFYSAEQHKTIDDSTGIAPSIVTPMNVKVTLFLSGEIGFPECYIEWFQRLQTLTPEDVVVIRVNCVGGVLDTSLQIYEALIHCPAKKSFILEGACCSGASMIAMAADSVSVADSAYMMIHSWSGGAAGKFGNVIENAEFQKKWFTNVMHNLYKTFLTEDEIERVLEGKDLWFDAKETFDRYLKVFKERDANIAQRTKEMKELSEHMKKAEDEFQKNKEAAAATKIVKKTTKKTAKPTTEEEK